MFSEALPLDIGLHMLTAGAIGLLTFGMMTRVILGHTGRNRKLRPSILTAYFLLLAALILRMIAPALPGAPLQWRYPPLRRTVVGGAYSFLITYALMLWRARPDGKPG